MGRIVEPQRYERVSTGRSGGLEGTGETQAVAVGGDDFVNRIAKYVPGEVLAGYLAIDRTVVNVNPKGNALESAPKITLENGILSIPDLWLAIGVFALCLIFTPIYIRQMGLRSGPGVRWGRHALIATLAFVVWAYAIQGTVFQAHGLYNPKLAGLLVLFFTLASGLVGPTPAGHDDEDRSTGKGSKL